MLRDWLERIGAVCQWQLPNGPEGQPTSYVECWLAPRSALFLLVIHCGMMGWEIYTAAGTNIIADSLADAERRLGLRT